jgi:hypothetical protein
METINESTPIVQLTVAQFKELLKETQKPSSEKRYIYGIAGLASLLGCSTPTANRFKKSGRFDPAITQIGRKIIIDADAALELAGRKNKK